jgi:hypothetical protein
MQICNKEDGLRTRTAPQCHSGWRNGRRKSLNQCSPTMLASQCASQVRHARPVLCGDYRPRFAPHGGESPLSIFESGAILEYLADESGRLLPEPKGPRFEVLAMAVLAGGAARADGRTEPPFRPLCARAHPLSHRACGTSALRPIPDILWHRTKCRAVPNQTLLGTYRHAFEFAAQVGAKQIVPFHHTPSHDDDMLDRLLEESTRRFKPSCPAAAPKAQCSASNLLVI